MPRCLFCCIVAILALTRTGLAQSPLNVEFVAEWQPLPADFGKIEVRGGYAYVTMATQILVFSLVNPDTPALANTFDVGVSIRDIASDSSYLYATTSMPNSPGSSSQWKEAGSWYRRSSCLNRTIPILSTRRQGSGIRCQGSVT